MFPVILAFVFYIMDTRRFETKLNKIFENVALTRINLNLDRTVS